MDEARRELEALLVEAGPDSAVVVSASAKINAIEAGGGRVLVDVLAAGDGSGVPDVTAFDIEAALIAVLGLGELGNKVRGHRLRLMPESVFDRAGARRQSRCPKTLWR